MSDSHHPYPPIADYALISDCHCCALVSRAGAIDWCCMPRVDADSCFGRLLDWDKGGYCLIAPAAEHFDSQRRYLPGTMVLETRLETSSGVIKLYDFFLMTGPGEQPCYDCIRLIEGISGQVELRIEVRPRFDYGDIIPSMRRHEKGVYSAVGSNMGLIIRFEHELDLVHHHDLCSTVRINAGEKAGLRIHFEAPEEIASALERDRHHRIAHDHGLSHTCEWWRNWSDKMRWPNGYDEHTARSALVLKSLTYQRTGAIVAAPTTSLPEWIGGVRNWDYRFCWVRDSVFTVRALYRLGCGQEADRFLQFIQRASAGSAKQLQIMYAVDGKRRLTEVTLDWLDGYRHSQPVRIGNCAAKQNQLDIYGDIMQISQEWRANGYPVDENYRSFLIDVVNVACEVWREMDRGIWEFRCGARHFVYSKAMCWVAMDIGIRLARDCGFDAPLDEWTRQRDAVREAIESQGYDSKRGIFVQSFGSRYLDASLLLLPRIGFVDYKDPRMIRTVDAIRSQLDNNGLLLRYDSPDGLPGEEGVFLPCTFWLVDCLANQGRIEDARPYYRRATACANDIGLYSEEYDPESGNMLGNYPQGLTHVSQINAWLSLAAAEAAVKPKESAEHESQPVQ